MRRILPVLLSFVLVAACGGAKKDNTTNKPVGDDLDVPKSMSKVEPKATGPDAGATLATNDAGATASQPPDAGAVIDPNAPFVTFRLKNSTEKDIELNLNRGWYIVIRAYTGEKGKNAKAAELFPRYCTAACSSATADRCPRCKRPKGNRDEKKAQKREIIAPGKHLDVPWDGKIHEYKRTRGRRGRRCSCYDKKQITDATYTVEGIGFHKTRSATRRSKLIIAKATMTISGTTKQVVELEFTKK